MGRSLVVVSTLGKALGGHWRGAIEPILVGRVGSCERREPASALAAIHGFADVLAF